MMKARLISALGLLLPLSQPNLAEAAARCANFRVQSFEVNDSRDASVDAKFTKYFREVLTEKFQLPFGLMSDCILTGKLTVSESNAALDIHLNNNGALFQKTIEGPLSELEQLFQQAAQQVVEWNNPKLAHLDLNLPKIEPPQVKELTQNVTQNTGLPEQVYNLLSAECYRCHGEDGSAEKDVFVLDYGRLVSSGALKPNDLNSEILRQVQEKKMPEDGELSEEQIALIRDWIQAGAKPWTISSQAANLPLLTGPQVATVVAQHQSNLTPIDRQFVRYISFAHLAGGGITAADLKLHTIALAKALNSTSWKPRIAVPQPVEGHPLVLAIDLRDLGWTLKQWSDLIGPAYPYGYCEPGGTDEKPPRPEHVVVNDQLVLVRGDWLIRQVTEPASYHNLLDIPHTLQELERRLGVDKARALNERRGVIAAGIRNSGVSRNNRLVHRYDGNTGAYYLSFDFQESTKSSNIFENPLSPKHAGGEVIFQLPNGLHGYMIVDANGKRIDEAPTNIVSDRTNSDAPVVVNGRSCLNCHFDGLKTLNDDTHEYLERITSVDYDLGQARAIYGGPDVVEKMRQEDQVRYQKALRELGLEQPPTQPKHEPIARVLKVFASDLRLKDVASELFMKKEDLEEIINRSDENLGFKVLTTKNGGMSRQVWEKQYFKLLDLLPNEAGLVQRPKLSYDPTLGPKWAEALEIASDRPAEAPQLLQQFIGQHKIACEVNGTLSCHELAESLLAQVNCRASEGYETIPDAKNAVLEALRARKKMDLEKSMACDFYLEFEQQAEVRVSKAWASAILELIVSESWNPQSKGTTLVGSAAKAKVELLFGVGPSGKFFFNRLVSNDRSTLVRLSRLKRSY